MSEADQRTQDEESGNPVLQMRAVTKRFGATIALENVDLKVAAGSVHALIGENGAGKSTLMKILSGAISADHGEIHLDGRPYSPKSPAQARLQGVAMIYQELTLAPPLNAVDNICLGREFHRIGIVTQKQQQKLIC